MEIIRNLGGVQKGLLGGLILGILVVYLCLCVSATGVVPLAPRPGRLETGVLAAVSTVTATATDSVAPTVAAAAPTYAAQPTIAAAVTPVPTDSPATPTLESTLAPTDAPTVQPSTATAEPVRVALAVEQATQPAAPPIQPTTHKAPVVPAATVEPAKTAATPAPASTPEWTWRGIEYERVPGSKTGNTAAVLAVRVVGVPDRKVFVREVTGGWNTTLVTGRKPEYGDFSDDVGGLKPSTYVIKPMDIDDEVKVEIDSGDYVLIEFALRPPANWTPVAEPAVAQAAPVAPPAPSTPVPVASAAAKAPVPTPTAVPDWAWQGIEYQRVPGTQSHNVFGTLAVRVVGVPDRKVFIREMSGGWTTTLVTGKKPDYGDFSDDVGALEPGTYVVKPMDIDNQISVQLNAGDFVLVEFALRPTHPLTGAEAAQATATVQVVQANGATPKPAVVPLASAPSATAASASGDWTWQGLEYQRIPGTKTANSVGVLAVRVVGVPNRKVFVREASGWSTTLVTGLKPEYGDFADAVGGLSPGTYSIKPMDIDNDIQVKLDTGDFVLVEFALRPAQVLTPSGSTPAGSTTIGAAPQLQPQKTGSAN
jgi:hypothetical protein